MKFTIPHLDLRSHKSGVDHITDEAGNMVGVFRYRAGSPPQRTVHLFGKYFGQFETPEECQAFADGVAAVLTHMTTIDHDHLARY